MTLRVMEIFKVFLMYVFNVWVLDFIPPQNLSH